MSRGIGELDVRPGGRTVPGREQRDREPQVAGVIALANAARAAAGKEPLGNLNPTLYSLPSSDYRDVTPTTEGTAATGVLDNNQLWQYNADGSVSPGPVAGFPTLTGWDMTTAFGSPIVGPFVASLAAQP